MTHTHTNRLAKESSPYLLQHAHNPVDWYPWGQEAFDRARAENKPIFLSVGYSTCYWCHVMERQSFENPDIAAEMNRRFINIKVDREERPDVDQLYMNAVQLLTRQGGWPMSVFLTPDLLPFHAGTYFPPDDSYGRPGFPRLLVAIDDAWRNRNPDVLDFAHDLTAQIEKLGRPPLPKDRLSIDEQFVASIIDRSTDDYDPVHAGFGSAPKFPRETLLELILVRNRHAPDEKRMKMLLHTLDAMADGGIHDHLGGAFHRYSTDAQWLVPHFEIMLYDNAMLTWIYAEAHAQTAEPRYARIARGIADFVLREMTSPQGAFYTALDAEVDAEEGQSYLWTHAEITALLGPDAPEFLRTYGVDLGPNFADPHHSAGVAEKNILYLPKSIDEPTHHRLGSAREKLYAARRQRKQPLLDTKILTSWNALMIRGLAHLARSVGDDSYLDAARRAAQILKSTTPRFLDDCAFLAQSLLDLGDEPGARVLATQLQTRFYDPDEGGFFFTASDSSDLILRQKVATDSPLPSGNAIAAQVFLQLGEVSLAQRTLGLWATQASSIGEAMSSMIQTIDAFIRLHGPFNISAATDQTAPAAPIVSLSPQWITDATLAITISIAPAYHINTNHPAAGLKATLLSISPQPDSIDYPPGASIQFAFTESPIPVYAGDVTIHAHFTQPPTATVKFSLSYQACNDTTCLAPAVARAETAPILRTP